MEMSEQRFAEARIAALFGVARAAYATTLAAGMLLVALLWGAAETVVLFAWAGALVVVTLLRLALHGAYRRDPTRRVPRDWELRFAAGALGAGVVWMLPPLLMFPVDEPLLQMAIVFVVGGGVIGAAGVYAASPWAFLAFCVPPIVATAAQFARQPDPAYTLLALLAMVFGAAMVRVYRDLHGNVIGALRARTDKESLLERVAQSEAQLRDAIESFPEGIAVYDATDRLVVCNEAYARVYGAGRGAAQLPGTSYREMAANAFDAEVVPPAFAERRDAWLEDRMARRRSGAGTLRHYETRDGRSLQGKFVRSRGGGIVSVFTDVTELRRTQDAYGRLAAEEQLMLDVLPVGVAFFSGRSIVRCNRRLEQMLGYGSGELAGQSSRILYPSEALWEEAGRRYQLLAGGQVLDGEFKLRRKDGGVLWCRAVGRAADPAAPQASVIVAYADTSERHAAERALRKSEAMYRNLVETSNDLIWSVDRVGRWTYLSPAATLRIYGSPAADLLGHEVGEVLAPELVERDLAVFRRILAGEPAFSYETRHLRRDGSAVDLAINAVPLRDAAGAVIGATGTARDITAEKAAAAAQFESVEKLRLAVEAAELEHWEWDRTTGAMRFGRVPGTPAPDGRRISFENWLERVHEEDRERCRAASLATQQRGEPYQIDFRMVTSAGELRWMHSRGKPILDAQGDVVRVIGVSQDITDRKRQEEEARFLAYHDTLTGLPNRRLLDDRLRQAIFLAQRRDGRVAVMVVDLDRFKQVNDALGHRAGDAVLREASHRIAGCVRKADTVARQGGDEFVVVIPDLAQDGDCQVVAEKILRALEPPFRVDGRDFSIGASIGISLYPADAGDGEGVLRNADVAMYRAKQLGRNNYRFYGR